MEQFVLIPRYLYEEKFRLDKPEKVIEPQVVQDQNLEPVYSEINSRLKSKNNSLVDKILASPRIKLSTSNTILMDEKGTGVAIADFIYSIKRERENFSDIYFTLLDASGISSKLVTNQNAKKKDRGNWIPFKI